MSLKNLVLIVVFIGSLLATNHALATCNLGLLFIETVLFAVSFGIINKFDKTYALFFGIMFFVGFAMGVSIQVWSNQTNHLSTR